MLITGVKRYPLLKRVTCRTCDIVFENTDTCCPRCGRIEDTIGGSTVNQKNVAKDYMYAKMTASVKQIIKKIAISAIIYLSLKRK